MTNLPCLSELIFESLQNSSYGLRKEIFKKIFLFYHGIVCCVKEPHQGNFNEYTQRTIIL